MYILYLFQYIIIYILTGLFNLCLKIWFRDLFVSVYFKIKQRSVVFLCDYLDSNHMSLDGIQLKLSNSLVASVKIARLSSKLWIPPRPKKTDAPAFELWVSPNKDLGGTFRNFNKLIHRSNRFNSFIGVWTITCSDELKVVIHGVNVFKLNNQEFIKLKLKSIKLYYLKKCIGSVKDLKVTLKSSKTIYIKRLHMLFNKGLINEYIINLVKKMLAFYKNQPPGILPKLMVEDAKINIYLHNYLCFTIKDFVIENDLLHLAKIKIKIWKKDSLWIDNFKINILEPDISPMIEKIRLRLFNSTGDKLYKSLIILRKTFLPINRNQISLKNPQYIPLEADYNYLNNITNDDPISLVKCDEIIDNYLALIHKFIPNYQFKIVNFIIKISYDYGSLYLNNLIYKKNDENTVISVNNWKYYNDTTNFISKNDGPSSCFNIEFSKKFLKVSPYNMDIYFDVFYFTNMLKILQHTIERINNIFYSNYYVYNKGYIYEHFQIDSFLTNLNYKKTEKNISALLSGKRLEYLNYIDISDLNLVFDDVVMSYPKDWDNISSKVGKAYRSSIYNNNFKHIVKKIYGKKSASVIYLKDNFNYVRNKLQGAIKQSKIPRS